MAGHYASVAAHYRRALFYAEGPLKQWQVGCVLAALDLQASHRLADVGGGDGSFAATLAEATGCRRVTLVEPSQAMLSKATLVGERLCEDGLTWARRTQPVDRVLLKEVVHHFEDRPSLFRALRAKAGRVVIVTRPREPPYPLFEAAREVWRMNQPDRAVLEDELQAAGFVVATSVHGYPLEVSRRTWIDMVKSRFWSTFSSFSDVDLQAGCDELEREYPETIHFEEQLVILVADSRPAPACWPLATRVACDGYAGPCDVAVDSALEDIDRYCGPAETLKGNARFKLHLLLPALADLVRSPALVDNVAKILGTDNVLVWSTDLVCKAPGSPGHFTPHQDSAYAGLAPADAAVTAWVALTDAPDEAGALRFFPRSHLLGPLPHVRGQDATNMLAFAQRVDSFSEDEAVAVPLKAGQCSWHFMRTVHWSPPNATARRRVGFAIRYVAADAHRTSGTTRESATLVSGDYDPAAGAFDLEPRPTVACGVAEREAHADAMAREAANYFAGDGEEDRRTYK